MGTYESQELEHAICALYDEGEIVAMFFVNDCTAIVWCLEDGWHLARHELSAERCTDVVFNREASVWVDKTDSWLTVFRDEEPVWRDDVGRIW